MAPVLEPCRPPVDASITSFGKNTIGTRVKLVPLPDDDDDGEEDGTDGVVGGADTDADGPEANTKSAPLRAL